jgi:hypothetical protein
VRGEPRWLTVQNDTLTLVVAGLAAWAENAPPCDFQTANHWRQSDRMSTPDAGHDSYDPSRSQLPLDDNRVD